MGQKVNPTGFRLGTLYTWKSRWFAEGKTYQDFLFEDIKLRKFLMEKLKLAGITNVLIERSLKTIKITLFVSRPGVVIGRGGSGLEELKKLINQQLDIKTKLTGSAKVEIHVQEVKDPDLSAHLVCLRIVEQLKKRYPHRRAVSQAIERVMGSGAKGIKIALAGRVAGAEISRTEKYSEGKLPLQTLRADIDYAAMPALTRSGYIGVKVWIFKGEKKI
ncbi:30S ribosomal protein S3 [Patescibacteria group bacterium]|nr:30S ribosomal protein S3 [Patescibacteria group bacterium]MBU1931284.1 30S ribosomal protein S3 [Patescibacteria group bacterium]